MTKGYNIPDIPNEVQSPLHFTRLKMMQFGGTDPAIIYAFRKTDLPMDPNDRALFSEDERKAWDDAIAEFQKANPGHSINYQSNGRWI